MRIPGRFALPAVAYDGLPAGLSADGRTLILVNPRKRFPRTSTTLAVIDPKRMRLRSHVHLSGDFSFDAISPDGRLLYLIQYLSKRDITDYAVRGWADPVARTVLLVRKSVSNQGEQHEIAHVLSHNLWGHSYDWGTTGWMSEALATYGVDLAPAGPLSSQRKLSHLNR